MAAPRYKRVDQSGFIEFLFDSLPAKSRVLLIATGSDGQQGFSLLTNESANKSIFFNSYYLNDGWFNIKLFLADSAENEIAVHTADYRICNGSSVTASELRASFRVTPAYALKQGPMDSSYFEFLPDHLKTPNYSLQARREAHATNEGLGDEKIDSFDAKGYLILDSFFDSHLIAEARKTLEEISEKELHGFTSQSSNRIVNIHEEYKSLNRLYSSKELYAVVSDLLGVQAYPCQSLVFINGSMQDPHQDTIHLTPFPRGLMCGIWIAIEDVVAGAGELVFYPFSHTLPAVLCSTHDVPKVDPETLDYSKFGSVFSPQIDMILASNVHLERKEFIAKAGDVLIWQENLIHGGSARSLLDQTRMSMVIHAFGEPALIYYDSLGMSGKRDIF